MKKNIWLFILMFAVVAITACSVKRPIVQVSDEDGYYNTDISINKALIEAAHGVAAEVATHRLDGTLSVVTISSKKEYETVANEVHIALLENGIKLVKLNEKDPGKINIGRTDVLTVYPTVYGIESPYVAPTAVACVTPPVPGAGPTHSGGRTARVTIYARLENMKTGIVKFEKEFTSTITEYADLTIK
ncbi:hypothetical protein KA005_62830 [bacterium]|nr:hypothetical protein [bacterium]